MILDDDTVAGIGAEWQETHGKKITIIRGAMAITSVLSSCTLIWMIVRSHVGLSSTYHRLLLGICIADIIFSSSESLFNVLAPSEVDYIIWNAKGNMATCNAQGFLLIFGLFTELLYNCSLNLYFLAIVKYGKTDDYMRTKMEPFMHGFPIVTAMSVAIASLVKERFNPAPSGTCIEPVNDMLHCIGVDDGEVREGFEIPCGRGLEKGEMVRIINIAVVFAPPIILLFSLGMIYHAVLKQEKKLSKYGIGALRANLQPLPAGDITNQEGPSSPWAKLKRAVSTRSGNSSGTLLSNSNSARSHSRAVMHKAIAYTCSYFLAWVTLIVLFTLMMSRKDLPIFVIYLAVILCPLQGFFNFIIFMFPRVMKEKASRNNPSWINAVKLALWSKGYEKRRGLSNRSNNLGNDHGVTRRKRRMRKQTRLRSEHRPNSRRRLATGEGEEEKCEFMAPQDMPLTHHNSRNTPKRQRSVKEGEECEMQLPVHEMPTSKDAIIEGSNVDPCIVAEDNNGEMEGELEMLRKSREMLRRSSRFFLACDDELSYGDEDDSSSSLNSNGTPVSMERCKIDLDSEQLKTVAGGDTNGVNSGIDEQVKDEDITSEDEDKKREEHEREMLRKSREMLQRSSRFFLACDDELSYGDDDSSSSLDSNGMPVSVEHCKIDPDSEQLKTVAGGDTNSVNSGIDEQVKDEERHHSRGGQKERGA